MKGKTAHCDWNSAPQKKPSPCDRYKHACVICRGFVYLYGGRNTTSLRDFWRYHIAKKEWEMLDCSRDGPEELEEHSMVAYKGTLYIFGGMVDSAFTQAKTPLWIYDIDSARWTECPNVPAETEPWVSAAPKAAGDVVETTWFPGEVFCPMIKLFQSSAPTNRKGHSAVVYHSSMYIYGGYFGIRGISQELWSFHFDTSKWLCVSTPAHSPGPGPRHGHSAVVYHTGMYLFGGLMGLSEQKDLWKWDFLSSSWSNIRTSHGPPPVVGHASALFKDFMLIFGGGISNSSPNGDLWKYHFHTQAWKKLSSTTKANFPPKMYHCILGIGVDFQTAPGVPSPREGEQGARAQQVTLPRHTRFCSSFRQQPACRGEGNAIEMKTFSLPLEPGGFCVFQTAPEAELDPNTTTTGILAKDKSLRFFVSSEKETSAAAPTVGEEEGADCQHAAAVDEVGCDSNVLLLIGGKPLSSFSEISFWQIRV